MTEPYETSQFVLTTHHDVIITSRLGKNNQLMATFC